MSAAPSVSQKKRSRFAKATTATPEGHPHDITQEPAVDDYMAPIETLLPVQDKIVQVTLPEKPQKAQKVSLQTLMDESREKSLAVPIDSSNAGFKLLKKFGYTEGEGLGKDGKGIVQPVGMSKRSSADATGLGVVEQQQRKQAAISAMQTGKKTIVEHLERNFRQDRIEAGKAAKRLQDLRRAQKAIYELDQACNIPVHRLTASLHQRYSDQALSADSSTAQVGKPRLREEGAEASRGDTQFSYSHALSDRYCDRSSGVSAQDTMMDTAEDLDSDEDTGHNRLSSDHDNSIETAERAEPLTEGDPPLEDCLQYLRQRHCYCYYCGVKYVDAEDFKDNCPGPSEEDH